MAGVRERRNVAESGEKEEGSFVLGMIGRVMLAFLTAVMLAFLFLPLISVFISRSPLQLISNLNTDIAYQALLLSLETTLISLVIIVVFGTPLAY
ncbi:MAG: hypothetical protein M3426_15605, partial [Actinomycetota bacterium]|nr:hypothetical protein [Actinomycetota bacterium]